MEQAAIIYNPSARNAPGRERLEIAAAAMLPEGWEIDLRPTEAAGHATELAREAAAAGASVVFACGGDGTINEVVNGLVGSETALGVLRGGMGNVFAKEVRIPREPLKALRLLVDGERRHFDLGVAADRYFLLMAGIGLDARVVADVPQKAKRRLGSTSYALWGLREAGRYHSQPALLRLEGVEREADLYWLLLANTRSYGGVLNIASRAVADDGLLDAYLFEAGGIGWLPATALRLALRRHEDAPGVTVQRLREVEVVTPGLPVQADGEYFGETPMRFSVAPSAISVLLPRGRGANLLSQPS